MDIADNPNCDAHVRRILRFGYLAPDIVEAIAEGRQPRSLTVKRLLQGIPCAWADQRTAFGLARSVLPPKAQLAAEVWPSVPLI